MAATPQQQFIQTWAITTFLCSLLLVALVVLIDPYGLFGTGLFPAVILTNRSQKIDAIRTMHPRPEAYIFGSSRVFRMDPEQVTERTGLTAYNASVSYARPEEHLALFRVLTEDLGTQPKLIVVGLSVGEFNHDPIDPQTITHPLLRKKLPISRTTLLRTIATTLKERVNPGMIRDMVTSIFFRIASPPAQVQFKDNGMRVPTPTEGDRTERIQQSIPGTITLFTTGNGLSPERLTFFSEFIARASASGTRIHVLLLPIAKDAGETIEEQTPYATLRTELLAQLHSLAAQHPGVIITDGSDPTSYVADPNDFADATHPREALLEALLNYSLTTEPFPKP